MIYMDEPQTMIFPRGEPISYVHLMDHAQSQQMRLFPIQLAICYHPLERTLACKLPDSTETTESHSYQQTGHEAIAHQLQKPLQTPD
jgi:hypothetical protein